ncbi:MAG: ABC transporter substrate-binding protein [Synechococcaceae cyanobacterium]|nr:ABC transporter substrate-binding protein [Synechococcaceae cyanobacterium]
MRTAGSPEHGLTLGVRRRRSPRRRRLLPAALLAMAAGAAALAATPSAPPSGGSGSPPAPQELVLGQSAPLSGPSAQLGREYRDGALAWFAEVNRRGGIHGRRLRLVSLDDRYEPVQTLRNTRRLIGPERSFVLFGYVGTPTVKAILPLVDRQQIPLVAPLTGARLLREPFRPLVFNLRASYQAEIDRIVAELVRAGRYRIAVLHQQDAFGEDGLRATRQALARHGLRPLAIAGVQRNSADTGAAARRLHSLDPSAVVIISAYPSSASFSRQMLDLGSPAQLMNVSFVGTSALKDALLGGQASGIGVSQVVPFPWDRRLPVVAQYQRLMRSRHADVRYGFTSLEGFLAARWLTEALQRAGPNPTRQRLVAAFEGMQQLDLDGFRLQLGPRDHQASDFVDLTYLGSQRWGP